MLFIAENLKSLRKGKDMTQEEVAEILGVSPQSVSKWERGDTYPDITFLPSLANLFMTSVDALVGMDKINDAEAKTSVFMKGQKLIFDGDNEGAAAIYADALKTYPNDETIMLELAMVLALDGDRAKADQAMSLCERILSGNPAEYVQYTARAALCYIYLKTGEKEKATKAAQKLPHARVSRETVLGDIEKNPSADEVNALISSITFRENAAYDILVIDFGLDMVPMVGEHDLLAKIGEVRSKAGQGKSGRHKLPMVRVRDNPDLPPNHVRVRYYADYLLDKAFPGPGEAVSGIIQALQQISARG